MKSKKIVCKTNTKTLLSTTMSVAMATVFSSAVYAVEPTAINLDNGLSVTPFLSTGYTYDNNIFSDATKTKSSGILTIAPSVNLLLDDGVNQYSADVTVTSGTFTSSSDDNFLNTELSGAVHLEPSSQSRFDLTGSANWLSEPRGTGITEGLGDSVSEPLTYAEQSLGVAYEYGALSSKARVAFNVDYYNKGYTNFEDFTKFRDYDSVKLGSTFYYSTGAATDALFEVSVDKIDYIEAVAADVNRDSNDYRALAGLKWEATALTAGEVKVGYQEKDFDNAGREKFSGLSWDASVQWQPLTYSTFDFATSRSAKDPNVIGDYIKESLYSASWIHNWSQRLASRLSTTYTNEEYSGIDRTDKTTTLSAAADYSLARWVDVSLFTDYTDKDSNQSNIYFDKLIVGVNFTMSM